MQNSRFNVDHQCHRSWGCRGCSRNRNKNFFGQNLLHLSKFG